MEVTTNLHDAWQAIMREPEHCWRCGRTQDQAGARLIPLSDGSVECRDCYAINES